MGIYKIFSVFGIELEYMIVESDSLSVSPIADQLIKKAAGKLTNVVEHGQVDWSNELVKHVIEIKNPIPGSDFPSLLASFEKELANINQMLEEWGCCLLPSSMHPWMNPATETELWPLENNEIYSTYDRLFNCRKHGFANLQSMHINLPFSGDEEFEKLHSAIRFLLPLIPFLAASSPFIEGKKSNARSERLLQYLKNQKAVPSILGKAIPDYSSSEMQYKTSVLEPMYLDVKPLDPDGVLHGEWLNSRAAIPKFEVGCIEIRLSDINECPKVDLALAEFWVCLTRWLAEAPIEIGKRLRTISTDSLREILNLAISQGTSAKIENSEFLDVWGVNSPTTGHQLFQHLLKLTDTKISSSTKSIIEYLLENGTLSERLIQRYNECGDLKQTYQPLVTCLKNNTLYE